MHNDSYDFSVSNDIADQEKEVTSSRMKNSAYQTPYTLPSVQSDDSQTASDSEQGVITEKLLTQNSSDVNLNVFWLQHDQWRRNVLEADPAVEVSDPIVAPRSLLNPKPPTLFKVSSALYPVNGHVRRRFRDFVWLRETLVNQYIGMIVPEIPEKSVIVSDKLLQSRMRGLSSFLSKVLSSPYLRTDSIVINFLGMEDQSRWRSYKKSVTNSKNDIHENSQSPNEGFNRWTHALQAYCVPPNENGAFSKVRNDVNVLESQLKKLVVEAEKVTMCSEDFSTAMRCFSDQAHTDGSNAKDANTVGMASEPVREVLESLGDVFFQWSELQSSFSSILDKDLYRALKHELNTLKELQRMFSYREDLIADIAKQNEFMSRLDAEKAALEYSGNTSKVAKLCDKKLKGNEMIRRANRELELMTKGMFLTEIDLFVNEKVKVYRKIIFQLSQATLEQVELLADSWRAAIAQFEPID